MRARQAKQAAAARARLGGIAALISKSTALPEFQLACLTLLFGTVYLITVPLRLAYIPEYCYGGHSMAVFTILDCACDAFFLGQMARAVRRFVVTENIGLRTLKQSLAELVQSTQGNISSGVAATQQALSLER